MGKRVYQAEDGSIFDTRAELDAYENKLALDAAFSSLGIEQPEYINNAMADAMIEALRPLATKKTRARSESSNGATKRRSRKMSEAEAAA